MLEWCNARGECSGPAGPFVDGVARADLSQSHDGGGNGGGDDPESSRLEVLRLKVTGSQDTWLAVREIQFDPPTGL